MYDSIWNHLVTLTRRERITVIVTTHYIEEARQANVVGLMRQGRLLAENSPDQLMADHSLDTLEDVFLKLCMSDMSIKAASLASYTTTIPRSDLNLSSNHHTLATKPAPEQTITSEQYNQIATNGDLRNIIKVSFLQSKVNIQCLSLLVVSVSIFFVCHQQGSQLRPSPCATSLHQQLHRKSGQQREWLLHQKYSLDQ